MVDVAARDFLEDGIGHLDAVGGYDVAGLNGAQGGDVVVGAAIVPRFYVQEEVKAGLVQVLPDFSGGVGLAAKLTMSLPLWLIRILNMPLYVSQPQKASYAKPCIQNRLSSAAEILDAGNSGSGCSVKIFLASCLPTIWAAEVLLFLCW